MYTQVSGWRGRWKQSMAVKVRTQYLSPRGSRWSRRADVKVKKHEKSSYLSTLQELESCTDVGDPVDPLQLLALLTWLEEEGQTKKSKRKFMIFCHILLIKSEKKCGQMEKLQILSSVRNQLDQYTAYTLGNISQNKILKMCVNSDLSLLICAFFPDSSIPKTHRSMSFSSHFLHNQGKTAFFCLASSGQINVIRLDSKILWSL